MTKKSKRKQHAKAPARPLKKDVYTHLKATDPIAKSDLKFIGALFVIAFALRLIYFLLNRNSNPLFYHPVLDGLFHHEWALEITSGNFWGDEVFFRAPLYPYLLALLYKVGGSSIAFAVLCQHILGSISVVLVYIFAREYFTRHVGLLAGLLAALYWPLIFFEGELLIVTLVIFLNLVMLILLSRAVKRQRLVLFLIAGFILGLSAIARPSILVILPVLPLVFHFGGRGAWRKQTAVLLVGLIVVVTPVVVRNVVVGGDFVPIASQGGVNFYIGNNPESNGTQAIVPGARADLHGTYRGAIELAQRDVGRAMKPSEVSNYYFRKGLDFLIFSPGEALFLTTKKFYFFWAGVERSNSKYIQFFWQKFGLGKLPLPGFWFLAPFALTGVVLLWPRRRELSLLYLFTLSYMIGVVVFFVNARFRLPVVPVLILFAAYAICALFYSFRYDGAKVWKPLVIFVVFALVVNYDFVKLRGIRSFDEAVSYFELGNAYIKMEKKDDALRAFEQARSYQDRYPTRGYMQISAVVDYHLGTLYWEKRQYDRAISPLERIQPNEEAARQTRHILADCYAKTGKLEQALSTWAKVLQISPTEQRALLESARIYKTMGDAAQAATFIERLRTLYPDDPELARQLDALEAPR